MVVEPSSCLLMRFCKKGGLRNVFNDDGTYSLLMLAVAIVEVRVVRGAVRNRLNLLNLFPFNKLLILHGVKEIILK